MADTIKSAMGKILVLEENLAIVTGALHDLIKLLMQDQTVHAMVAHRGKWKAIIEALESIKQEVDDGSES